MGLGLIGARVSELNSPHMFFVIKALGKPRDANLGVGIKLSLIRDKLCGYRCHILHLTHEMDRVHKESITNVKNMVTMVNMVARMNTVTMITVVFTQPPLGFTFSS